MKKAGFPLEPEGVSHPDNPHPFHSFEVASKAAAIFTLLSAGSAVLGRMTDGAALRAYLPFIPAMKPFSGLAFLLAGMSLWLLHKEPSNPNVRRVARAGAVTVLLIGHITLAQYVYGWSPDMVPRLSEPYDGSTQGPFPDRPSPNAAASFILVGSALWVLAGKNRGKEPPAQWFALTTVLISLLALVGHIYGVREMCI